MAENTPEISLCMIVKNEAEMLPGCIESVRELVDEIIVVDTGSTDATAQMAADLGASVLTYEWKDDFSEARNVSIRQAAGNWILWLDADERLHPDQHGLVRKAARAKRVDAYNVPIHNLDEKGGHFSRGHRLFRNRMGIEFSGTVHEQISPSFRRAGARVGDAGFVLEHLGYNFDKEKMAEKHQRNLRLLKAAREKDSRDAYVRFTLGQTYLLLGDKPAAEKEILAALGESTDNMSKSLPPDIRAAGQTNLAECALARQAYDEALRRCKKSLQICAGQATAHLTAYQVYTALGDSAQALEELVAVERLYKKSPGGKSSAVEVTVPRSSLWRTMAQLYLKTQPPEKAADYFRKVLQEESDDASALAGLSECALVFIREQRFDEAAEIMIQLLKKRPQDETLRRRLAGVFMKAGREEEARRTLVGERCKPALVTACQASG